MLPQAAQYSDNMFAKGSNFELVDGVIPKSSTKQWANANSNEQSRQMPEAIDKTVQPEMLVEICANSITGEK